MTDRSVLSGPSRRVVRVGLTTAIQFGKDNSDNDDDDDGMEDTKWGDDDSAPSSLTDGRGGNDANDVDVDTTLEDIVEGEVDEERGGLETTEYTEPGGSKVRGLDDNPSDDENPDGKAMDLGGTPSVDARKLKGPGSDLGGSIDEPGGEPFEAKSDVKATAEGQGGSGASQRRLSTSTHGSDRWEYFGLGARRASVGAASSSSSGSRATEDSEKAYRELMKMMRGNSMLLAGAGGFYGEEDFGRKKSGRGNVLSSYCSGGGGRDDKVADDNKISPSSALLGIDRKSGRDHFVVSYGGSSICSSNHEVADDNTSTSSPLLESKRNERRRLFARRCARAMMTFAVLATLSGTLVYLVGDELFDEVMYSLRGISSSRMVLNEEEDDEQRDWAEEGAGAYPLQHVGIIRSGEVIMLPSEVLHTDARRRRAQRHEEARTNRKRMNAVVHNQKGGGRAMMQDPSEGNNGYNEHESHIDAQVKQNIHVVVALKDRADGWANQQQRMYQEKYYASQVPVNNGAGSTNIPLYQQQHQHPGSFLESKMVPTEEGHGDQQDYMYSWEDIYQMYVDENEGVRISGIGSNT